MSRYQVPYWTGGLMLGLIGVGLRFWAVSWIGSGSRRRDNERPKLCEEGPYALTRNPLYIANVILYVGLCLAGGLPLLALGVFFYSIGYYHCIVSFEESIWVVDSEYRAYCQRVRRWFPTGAWTEAFTLGPILPALRSERSSLLAWGGCMLLIWVSGFASK